MIKIFLIQLIFALVPSLCGLILLAYLSPKTFRLAKKSFQFDWAAAALGIVFLACLVAIHFALVNSAAVAVAGESFRNQFGKLADADEGATRIFAVYCLSFITLPAVMFGRLILEVFGEKPLET